MLRKKDETQFETTLCTNLKNEIKAIKEQLDFKSKEELYQSINYYFKHYLNSLLLSRVFMTEQEIISKLKIFNIDKSGLDMVQDIFDEFIQIDYNNKSYSKEDLFNLVIRIEAAADEIDIQRKAYHLSKTDKLLKIPKEKVLTRFKSATDALKKYNPEKIDYSSKHVVTLTELYPYLEDEKKDEFSKEYYSYCKIIPELNLMLKEFEEVKDDTEKNEVISSIKKLFVKLDEDKKQFFYQRITPLLSEEQKIDFLLSLGYNQLTNRRVDSAIRIYQSLSIIYPTLSDSEKKYYQPILIRYLSSIKKFQSRK